MIEPVFRPLGYDWKIGVSILSSFAAREVFVSTMGTIYGVGSDTDETSTALREKLRTEARRAPAARLHAADGGGADGLLRLRDDVHEHQRHRGAGDGRGVEGACSWAGFQFAWMFVLAYGAAFLVYRAGLLLGFGG